MSTHILGCNRNEIERAPGEECLDSLVPRSRWRNCRGSCLFADRKSFSDNTGYPSENLHGNGRLYPPGARNVDESPTSKSIVLIIFRTTLFPDGSTYEYLSCALPVFS